MRRSTLAQLTRIEDLRWKCLQLNAKLCSRRFTIMKEIKELGGDAFVPAECYEAREDGERLPRRIVVEQGKGHHSDGWSQTYDDEFWKFKPVRLLGLDRGAALSQLAEVGDLKEWDEAVARQVAEISPEKLDAGLRYWRIEERSRAQHDRLCLLNALIEMAVRHLGLIRTSTRLAPKKLATLRINGRDYPFEVDCGYFKPMWDYWPYLDDTQTFVVPVKFVLDDSIIGVHKDAVRTRLGEPDSSVEHDGALVFLYGDRGLLFGKGDKVASFLASGEVERLRPKPAGKSKQVKRGR